MTVVSLSLESMVVDIADTGYCDNCVLRGIHVFSAA